jgi:ATP-dependent Clp protease protease subunit
MIRPTPPPWFAKAKEIAARAPSPVGKPFAAATKDKKALLYLFDAIGKDPWSGTGIDPMDVVKAIAEAKGADELEVHISSPGGFVFDGIAIFNAIRAFDGKKTVYVDGIAASIASVIALAGDRVITGEGSMWMIHEPMGGVFSFGDADEIEDDARKMVASLRKIRETLLDVYVTETGQSISDLSAWMAAETWMTAAEAKARGFTDEIATMDPDEMDPDMEPEKKKKKMDDRAARALTPDELVARALAEYADIHQRFGGASPASKPGEPGKSNAAKPDTRQEQAK